MQKTELKQRCGWCLGDDLYEEYENEKDSQKKQEIQQEITRKYKEKMIIDKESNPPRVGVLIANPVPPPDTSIQPLFTLGVRAKGITAAPALEMGQTVFGGLCFKNGTVDINKWPDKDRKKFVNSEVKRVENDFNTVAGIEFYQHKETPGLGAEVDNPKWKALWPGKQIYQNNDVALKVIKGKVESDDSMNAYKVDGLSGATLTSRGVSNMIEYWFSESGYSSMLTELDYES